MTTQLGTGPAVMVQRLCQATNDHDLDALAGCFAAGLPQRDTRPPRAQASLGRDQVRANWAQIFAAVPDVRADVLRWVERRRHRLERVGAPRYPPRRQRPRHAGRGDLRCRGRPGQPGPASTSSRSKTAAAASMKPSDSQVRPGGTP